MDYDAIFGKIAYRPEPSNRFKWGVIAFSDGDAVTVGRPHVLGWVTTKSNAEIVAQGYGEARSTAVARMTFIRNARV